MIDNQLGLVSSTFVFLVISLTFTSIGLFLLRKLSLLDYNLQTILLSFSLGGGLFGVAISSLSLCGLFKMSFVLPLMLLLLFSCGSGGYRFYRDYFAIRSLNDRFKLQYQSRIDFAINGWLALIVILYFIAALSPEISGDPLSHNLSMPKAIAQSGSFLDIWKTGIDSPHTTAPKLVDHFYALGILFGSDTISSLLNFAFLITCLLAIFAFVRQYTDDATARWAVLAVSLMPVVIYSGTVRKLDLGMAMFELSAAYCLYLFCKQQKISWLIIASSFIGFALGARYNGLNSAALFTGLLLIYVYRQPPLRAQWQKILSAWILPATILSCLWYLANFILYGNPLFPFYDSIFHPLTTDLVFEHWGGTVPNMMDSLGAFIIPMTGPFGWFKPLWHFSFYEGAASNVWTPLILASFPLILSTRIHRERWVRYVLYYFTLSYILWSNQIHLTRTLISPLALMTALATIVFLRVNNILGHLLRFGLICLFVWSSLTLVRGTYGRIPYVLGIESREEFLEREISTIPNYPSLKMTLYANGLPAPSKVLLINAPHGYYLDQYLFPTHKYSTELELADLLQQLSSDKVSHIFINTYNDTLPMLIPEENPILSPLLNAEKLQKVLMDTVQYHPSSIFKDKRQWTQHFYEVVYD